MLASPGEVSWQNAPWVLHLKVSVCIFPPGLLWWVPSSPWRTWPNLSKVHPDLGIEKAVDESEVRQSSLGFPFQGLSFRLALPRAALRVDEIALSGPATEVLSVTTCVTQEKGASTVLALAC